MGDENSELVWLRSLMDAGVFGLADPDAQVEYGLMCERNVVKKSRRREAIEKQRTCIIHRQTLCVTMKHNLSEKKRRPRHWICSSS